MTSYANGWHHGWEMTMGSSCSFRTPCIKGVLSACAGGRGNDFLTGVLFGVASAAKQLRANDELILSARKQRRAAL